MERSSCSFINIHTVDNANDGGIDRCSFTANRLRRGTALDHQQHLFVHAGVDWAIPPSGRHAGRAAADDQDRLANAGVDGIDGNEVGTFSFSVGVHGPRDQQFAADQPRVLPRRDDGPDDTRENHPWGCLTIRGCENYAFAPAVAFPIGSASSRFACGRGMTCTETSSPTRRAAAAPASVAAFTAATSPRTIAVT